MMKKYIIKNCPNLSMSYYGTGEKIENECGLDIEQLCKDIPNCQLKKITNTCRNELEKRDAYSVSIHYDFAREILKFVETEDCE